MSQSATLWSLRGACRLIKRQMNFLPEGWEDPKEAGRRALKRILEARMRQRVRSYIEEELSQGIHDRFNGSYSRHLLTSLGSIVLDVPRSRCFSPVTMAQAYARRTQDVDRCILACFVLGLSTRKVAEALLPVLGERVSASTVSQVAKILDQAVEAFHRRRLANDYCVLEFDGVVLARKTGVGAKRRPVLVALGIRPDGRKEIIDFLMANSESQGAWEGFLNDLYQRGLTGEGIEQITIDGCAGLRAAIETVYPRIPVQRCWAHKVRNILKYARLADQKEMKRGLQKIYEASTRLGACQAVVRFAVRWEESCPKAVKCLMRDLEELLTYFQFEDAEWRKASRTTNAIERRFVEVRRRTRPMGVFSDRTSIERIMYALFAYENQRQKAGTLFLLTQNT
jgi:transposase-like protein